MAFFCRKIFGAGCLAFVVFAFCVTSGVSLASSALAGVLAFCIGSLCVIGCEVCWDTLREVAVGIANDVVWDIELAAVVPAAGGMLVGVPLGAFAGAVLPPAEVAAGTLAGWHGVVQGRIVED
jgi:hypothetical protein